MGSLTRNIRRNQEFRAKGKNMTRSEYFEHKREQKKVAQNRKKQSKQREQG